MALQNTVTLHDGVSMPLFGIGLSKIEPGEETENVVSHALKAGYRLLDCASLYRNEASVGSAIRKSGLKREDIFVVNKVWNHGKESCLKEFHESLEQLGILYIDLYLMHHPIGGKVLETYQTMLELQKNGLIRSIGVANFNIHHLEALKSAGLPLPTVNQFQLHPFQRNQLLVDYCRAEGITVCGYSPLAKMQKQDDPLLNQMSTKYKKYVSQIMIRWSVQKGYIAIPRSSNLQHITDNAEVFDFELTDTEMAALDNCDPHNSRAMKNFDPHVEPWTD